MMARKFIDTNGVSVDASVRTLNRQRAFERRLKRRRQAVRDWEDGGDGRD